MSTNFPEALGRTIKVLRTDRGLERKELAERSGISYSYLAEIESGTKQPSSQVLLALAEALGLRSHELLAQAEHRRDRAGTGADPWWLTGAAPQAATLRMPPPASSPQVAVGDQSGPDLGAFIGEITNLGEHLTVEDREVILNLARKLARPRRFG